MGNKISPITPGSPSTEEDVTDHQFIGTCIPVKEVVRFIRINAIIPEKAFKIMDFIGFLLFINNTKSIRAVTDKTTNAEIFKNCIKKPPYKLYGGF